VDTPTVNTSIMSVPLISTGFQTKNKLYARDLVRDQIWYECFATAALQDTRQHRRLDSATQRRERQPDLLTQVTYQGIVSLLYIANNRAVICATTEEKTYYRATNGLFRNRCIMSLLTNNVVRYIHLFTSRQIGHISPK